MSIFAPRFRFVVYSCGHVGVHTQRVQRLHVKQLSCRSCVDQLADIDRARRHHSVERRVDFFECLQLLSAAAHWPAPTCTADAVDGRLVRKGFRVLLRNRIRSPPVPGSALPANVRCWRWLPRSPGRPRPAPVADPVPAWRSPPAARPSSRARRYRSTTSSGSPNVRA